MSITPEEREKLHQELDAIIDMRNSYSEQKLKYDEFMDYKLKHHGDETPTEEEVEIWLKLIENCNSEAHNLVLILLKLSGNISGYDAQKQISSTLPHSENEISIIRSAFANWLEMLSQFFQENEDGESHEGAILQHLALSLEALNAGETTEILSPLRTSGLRINSFTLAKHQLVALCWVRHLIAIGEKPHIAHSAVSKAYGTNWDTIRKWEEPCKRALNRIARSYLKDAEAPNEEFFPQYIYSRFGGKTACTLEECGKLYQDFKSNQEKT
jgi:hypothetical protein